MPRPEEGRLRHSCIGPRRTPARAAALNRADDAWTVGHHRRDQREPAHFQRMNSYSMYRIAETIRVLLFIDAGDSDFQLLSRDAVMIVMLALLNEWRHPFDRLRQRPLQGSTRSME